MTANIGDTDRYIRIAVGCALVIWWLLGGPIWGGAIGAVLLATALIRWCPAYGILRMSTCETKKE